MHSDAINSVATRRKRPLLGKKHALDAEPINFRKMKFTIRARQEGAELGICSVFRATWPIDLRSIFHCPRAYLGRGLDIGYMQKQLASKRRATFSLANSAEGVSRSLKRRAQNRKRFRRRPECGAATAGASCLVPVVRRTAQSPAIRVNRSLPGWLRHDVNRFVVNRSAWDLCPALGLV